MPKVSLGSLALALLCAACGARTGFERGDELAADAGTDTLAPCAPLHQRQGSYRGSWQGVVNCLVEKHPTEGTLSFTLASALPQQDGLRVDGNFVGTFSNGLSLKSRISGWLGCSGQVQVDLVDISVGHSGVSQLSGWLRGWAFSSTQSTTRRVGGSWRIDQWDPLCIGAGSWQATQGS